MMMVATTSVSYYEADTGRLGFRPYSYGAEGIRNAMGTIDTFGKPFVVVADSSRIYLGAIVPEYSSYAFSIPFVYLEQAKNTDMLIEPPTLNEYDPRYDPKLLNVFSESGKLLKAKP